MKFKFVGTEEKKMLKYEKKLKKLQEDADRRKLIEDKIKGLQEESKKDAKSPNEQLSLNQKIDKVLEYFDETVKSKKGKSKKYKLPTTVRAAIKNYEKKSKILVFLIRTNKALKPIVTQIFKGMVFINGNWYNVPVDSIMIYKDKMKYIPTIILPEWDLKPLTPDKLYGDAVENKRMIDPQTIIIRAIKAEQALTPKMGFGGKAWIWIVLAGIAVIYVIFSK